MAFGPLFPELSATTLNELVDSFIYQNSYVGTPFQRYMRASGAYDPFGGGAGMQVPDLYQGVGGGALFPGEDVTIMDEQVITASLFQPKAYAKYKLVNDFVIEAQNKGPEARVALLEAYLNQMTEGIDFQIEGDMFRHGQASGNGVNDNRLASINGISEALNDGVVPSWDGNVFLTYGGQTRNGAIGASLNSTPIWLGDQNGNPAPPNYQTLLKTYLTPIQNGGDKLGVTSYLGYSSITSAFQRQERYFTRDDKHINWEGIKLENGTIFYDDIVPSSAPKPSIASLFSSPSGTAPSPGAIQTGQFTLTAAMIASNQGISNLPNLGFTSNATKNGLAGGLNQIVVGEPLFWITPDKWKYREADGAPVNYFFMDPARWPENPFLYVQWLRHVLNFYQPTPREDQQCYGILG
jgi:hypothetical protein